MMIAKGQRRLIGLMAICVACVCGCSEQETSPAGAVVLNIDPNLSVGSIRAGMTAAQVVEALGEPKRKTAKALQYPALGLAVILGVDSQVVGVMCGDVTGPNGPYAKAFTGRTKEGIGMRSKRDELLNTYGQPSDDQRFNNGQESISYANLGLTFTLDRGLVHHIIVRLSGEAVTNPPPSITIDLAPQSQTK